MKTFLRNFARGGLLFGLFMGLFYGFQSGFWYGVIGGSVSGLTFGLLIAAVASFFIKRTENERPEFSGETIIKQAPANQVIQGHAVGGMIYLTDKQIYFQPHKAQSKAKTVSIPISDILKAQAASDPTLLAGRLDVERTYGIAEKFAIDDVGEWVEAIIETRRYYLDSPRSEDARLFP